MLYACMCTTSNPHMMRDLMMRFLLPFQETFAMCGACSLYAGDLGKFQNACHELLIETLCFLSGLCNAGCCDNKVWFWHHNGWVDLSHIAPSSCAECAGDN